MGDLAVEDGVRDPSVGLVHEEGTGLELLLRTRMTFIVIF